MGRRLIFDLETNGFLEEADTIHSCVMKDVETEEMFSYGPGKIDDAIGVLYDAEELIGHNVMKFDVPMVKKLYGIDLTQRSKITDTLVMARTKMPDTKQLDIVLMKQGKLPKKLFKRHSLEAWGHRLGEYKGDYKGGWEKWSEEMQRYCEQDVEVTFQLYQRCLQYPDGTKLPETAIWLEHEVAKLCSKMEDNGFPLDEDAAVELYATLAGRREELTQELQDIFPPKVLTMKSHYWLTPGGGVWETKKEAKAVGFKDKQITHGDKKTKSVPFNPGSRTQIELRLKEKYGWEPVEFTDKGRAKIDETILGELSYPEAQVLAEYFLVDKRIGQIAEGDQAWLKVVKDGRIHAQYNPNGANTTRATHFRPNITQVPKIGKPYGKECRACFHTEPGWTLVGTDAAGLELRCLAHYMAPFDGGAYGRALLQGDIHTTNQKAAGLPTRDNAKTFIYATLYGAGNLKIGNIIGKGPQAGSRLRSAFEANTPGYKKLKKAIENTLKERDYLNALDGRRLTVRSKHSALNLLLQSAGALICKYWIVAMERLLLEQGLDHGADFRFHVWAHDEVQVGCRTQEIAQAVAKASGDAIKETRDFFNFNIPLAADYKPVDEEKNLIPGFRWGETH